MKIKLVVLSCFILFSLFIWNQMGYCQTPDYLWIYNYGDTSFQNAYCMTTDPSGDIFVAGVFTASSMVISGTTIVNSGSPNSVEMFLAKFSGTGTLLWVNAFGGNGDDTPKNISLDNDGNIYLSGYFDSPTLNIGTFSISNNGLQDVFLSKFNNNGTPIWAKGFGGNDHEFAEGMDVLNSEAIFVGGSFQSPTVYFDSYAITSSSLSFSSNVFITKLDTAGNVLWAKSPVGDSGADLAYDVTVDDIGNSYLTGSFGSTQIIFDNYTLVNNFIFSDIFLVKYDPNGIVLWAKHEGTMGSDNGYIVHVDNNSDVYLSGSYESYPITFGSYTLPVYGSDDLFIVKYDSSGSHIWAKGYGGNAPDDIFSISNDSLSNLYLFVATWSDTINFDGTILSSLGDNEIFILKVNSLGQLQWDKQIHGIYNETPTAISYFSSDELYICGNFGSPVCYFDLDSLNNFGMQDFFLAKIGNTGLAVQELNSRELFVGPNPGNDQLFVRVEKEDELIIFDNVGRKVLVKNVNPGLNTIDISFLSAGYYILTNSTDRIKFVKQ